MFILAKTRSGVSLPDVISTTVNAADGKHQGVLTVAFEDVDTVHMVGYGLGVWGSTTSSNSLPPTPFFEDKLQITVFAAGALPSPSTSSPGQTQTATIPSELASPASSVTVVTLASSSQSSGTGDQAQGPPKEDSMTSSGFGLADDNGGSFPTTPAPTTPDDAHSSASSHVNPPEMQHQSNIAVIIGASLGALALVILSFVMILRYRRRKQGGNWRIKRADKLHGEDMIERRGGNQLEKKAIVNNRDSAFEPLSSTTPAPLIASCGDDDVTSALFSASHSRRDSKSTLDHTIYTLAETESGTEATSTIELTSTEITHEYIRPRTDRQMEIEGKIFEIQGQIIRLNDRSRSSTDRSSTPMSMDSEMLKLRERVGRLREIQGEEWAMELTEEVPLEMVD
ncbi:hypothetical protein PQX77_000907 [Marasmius sp. AFHP31]|nr:hypothetical protein PQX77_000907 [Marasmius sp. AFHP31]